MSVSNFLFFFFFNDTAPPEIYTYGHTLSLHDALPISRGAKVETMEGGAMTSEIYENVWDALADTEQEAANLKLRSSLLYEIRKVVQGWNVSQDEAGKRLGLTRPRTNDLLRGKLAKFSLDALVNIAASAHLHVELTLKEAA